MSLVKKPRLTAKKLAAMKRNQKLSHGPKTAEGVERIRAAHLRHGRYAQWEETALLDLGEDSADLEDLREKLQREWRPRLGSEEELVERLARALWRMQRFDRMQEGIALRQAQAANRGREARLHAQMMNLKIQSTALQLLAQSVAQEYYVTTPGDLEQMQTLHGEGVMKELGEIALALFYQLQAPGAEDSEKAREEDELEKARTIVTQARAIFNLPPFTPEEERRRGFPPKLEIPQEEEVDVTEDFDPVSTDPSFHSGQALKVGATEEAGADLEATTRKANYPQITEEEWEARERPRQLLENILKRQVELCEMERVANLRECVKGPSPYERAAEIAPTHPSTLFVQRMEDSYFRQIWRLKNLLMKIKQHASRVEASGAPLACEDVNESKGG